MLNTHSHINQDTEVEIKQWNTQMNNTENQSVRSARSGPVAKKISSSWRSCWLMPSGGERDLRDLRPRDA